MLAQKTVEAVVKPKLGKRWWRWRRWYVMPLLCAYWLSGYFIYALPLREGYVYVSRVIAANVFLLLLSFFFLRFVYRGTKQKTRKIGFLWSLLGWLPALKLLGIALFVTIATLVNLLSGTQSIETVDYRIEDDKIVIDCLDKKFDINRATAERIEAVKPSGLHIVYWRPHIVHSVWSLPGERAKQVVNTCG